MPGESLYSVTQTLSANGIDITSNFLDYAYLRHNTDPKQVINIVNSAFTQDNLNANRLRRLIEFATFNPCVLFFDEFEAVGKERSDTQETGEIKRVVSTLLVQMDQLPSHTLVVCATNHPELLDRAVWRRFEMKLEIDKPGPQQLKDWFKKFEQTLQGPSGITPEQFADYMKGESMATVEAFTLDVRRKVVLSRGKISPAEAIRLVVTRSSILAPIKNSREGAA